LYDIKVKKLRNAFYDKEFENVFNWFCIIKIIIFLSVLGGLFIPQEHSAVKDYLDNKFLNAFAQFDASAYLDIAKNGYNQEYNNNNGNYSYFPLYPILIKLLSYIFGIGWSAFLISNILSFACVFLLYVVIKDYFDINTAYKATMWFIFFPVIYFFSMMYTESLFFTLILLMFYYAKRNKWWLVGVLGFLATATRMPGVVMFFPMAYMYWKQNKKFKFNFLWLGLIGLSLLLIFFYHYYLVGDALIMFHTFDNTSYGFGITIPGLALIKLLWSIFQQTNIQTIFYMVLNIIFGFSFIYLTILSWQFKQKELPIFMTFYLLLILVPSRINAHIRYYMLMFPGYIILSKINNKITKFIYMLFLSLIILFVIRHVNSGIIL